MVFHLPFMIPAALKLIGNPWAVYGAAKMYGIPRVYRRLLEVNRCVSALLFPVAILVPVTCCLRIMGGDSGVLMYCWYLECLPPPPPHTHSAYTPAEQQLAVQQGLATIIRSPTEAYRVLQDSRVYDFLKTAAENDKCARCWFCC